MLISLMALAAAATQPEDPRKKVKCVKQEVTGSLLGAKRVCRTVEEWELLARENERVARDAATGTEPPPVPH